MKYGRQRWISARQTGSTLPSAFCSSVMPQRRSTSPQVTPRDSHSLRSSGKTCLTSSSRSACMSRNVDETKTRIRRSGVIRVASASSRGGIVNAGSRISIENLDDPAVIPHLEHAERVRSRVDVAHGRERAAADARAVAPVHVTRDDQLRPQGVHDHSRELAADVGGARRAAHAAQALLWSGWIAPRGHS